MVYNRSSFLLKNTANTQRIFHAKKKNQVKSKYGFILNNKNQRWYAYSALTELKFIECFLSAKSYKPELLLSSCK